MKVTDSLDLDEIRLDSFFVENFLDENQGDQSFRQRVDNAIFIRRVNPDEFCPILIVCYFFIFTPYFPFYIEIFRNQEMIE